MEMEPAMGNQQVRELNQFWEALIVNNKSCSRWKTTVYHPMFKLTKLTLIFGWVDTNNQKLQEVQLPSEELLRSAFPLEDG